MVEILFLQAPIILTFVNLLWVVVDASTKVKVAVAEATFNLKFASGSDIHLSSFMSGLVRITSLNS